MYCRKKYWNCCNPCPSCCPQSPCTPCIICPKGATGPIGPIGPTGATGATGATGPTGADLTLAYGGLSGEGTLSLIVPAGGVVTQIPLNAQMPFQNVTYQTNAIEIIEDGTYQIQTNIGFASANGSFGASFSLGYNGTQIGTTYTNLVVDTEQQFIANIIYDLSAGDVISVLVNSVAGGTINFITDASGYLTVNKIG